MDDFINTQKMLEGCLLDDSHFELPKIGKNACFSYRLIKLVPCYVCNGIGTIPDVSSTVGNKICPCCNGAKAIHESINIKLE